MITSDERLFLDSPLIITGQLFYGFRNVQSLPCGENMDSFDYHDYLLDIKARNSGETTAYQPKGNHACVPFICILVGVLFANARPSKGNASVNAPMIGLRWSPWARYKFCSNANSYVQQGYRQVKGFCRDSSRHSLLLGSSRDCCSSCLLRIYWFFPISTLTSFEIYLMANSVPSKQMLT